MDIDYKQELMSIWNELNVLDEVPENYTTQELLEKYASLQERYHALESVPEGISLKEAFDILIPIIQRIHYMKVFFADIDFKNLLEKYNEGV